MTWQEAHLRLISTLPVRSVVAKVRQEERVAQQPANVVRTVIVRGKRYETLREAAQALKTSRYMVKVWINEGKARYAESDTGAEE